MSPRWHRLYVVTLLAWLAAIEGAAAMLAEMEVGDAEQQEV